MTLLKTSLLSFIATSFKMLSGLIINKIVAVYIGPSGLAIIGQFQNFLQIANVFAQGGTSSGVTKYLAEYHKDTETIKTITGSALFITLICASVIGLLVIIFANPLAQIILHSTAFYYAFITIGFTIIFAALNGLTLAILNGMKALRSYIIILIIQSICSVLLASILIIFYGIKGALIALAVNQAAVFIVVLILLWKNKAYRAFIPSYKFRDSQTIKKLLKYSAMAATSIVLTPLTYMIIRSHIGETIGWDGAGYWQAVLYISQTYLAVITTTLSIYYLPRLSEIKDKKELRKEILNGYRFIMPFVIFAAGSIYFLRDIIIALLFSQEFNSIRDLFLFQLLGDIIKMAAWLCAFLLLAKAMTRAYILTEIIFTLSFAILSYILINNYGLIGVTYAYFINCCFYLPCAIYFVRRQIW